MLITLGSLFPDIDHPKSILGKYNVMASLMKHRGFMHTIPAILLLYIPFISVNPIIYFYFAWGYIFHLIGDSLTKTGIMWLYPLKKKYYSLYCDEIYGVELMVWGLSMLFVLVKY